MDLPLEGAQRAAKWLRAASREPQGHGSPLKEATPGLLLGAPPPLQTGPFSVVSASSRGVIEIWLFAQTEQ